MRILRNEERKAAFTRATTPAPMLLREGKRSESTSESPKGARPPQIQSSAHHEPGKAKMEQGEGWVREWRIKGEAIEEEEEEEDEGEEEEEE